MRRAFFEGFLNRGYFVKKVGLYARVSKCEQHTLPMQIEEMHKYVNSRSWIIELEVQDIGSGARLRPKRDLLLKAARKRSIDAILVWRLDRWGRSLEDLITTLGEIQELDVSFISITEALDLSTSFGKAMAGLLSVFAQFERDLLRERVKAGIAHARKNGKPHGRPKTAVLHSEEVKTLHAKGFNNSQIARKLKISRTSVWRILKND